MGRIWVVVIIAISGEEIMDSGSDLSLPLLFSSIVWECKNCEKEVEGTLTWSSILLLLVDVVLTGSTTEEVLFGGKDTAKYELKLRFGCDFVSSSFPRGIIAVDSVIAPGVGCGESISTELEDEANDENNTDCESEDGWTIVGMG